MFSTLVENTFLVSVDDTARAATALSRDGFIPCEKVYFRVLPNAAPLKQAQPVLVAPGRGTSAFSRTRPH